MKPAVPLTKKQGSSREGQLDTNTGEGLSLDTLSSLISLDDNLMGNFRYLGTRKMTGSISLSAIYSQNERGDRSLPMLSMRETTLDDSNSRIMSAFSKRPQYGLRYTDQGRPTESSTEFVWSCLIAVAPRRRFAVTVI